MAAMGVLFKVLGLALACYVVRALTTGMIYARSGVWGRTFRRDEDALAYWSAVIAYFLLSIVLLLVF